MTAAGSPHSETLGSKPARRLPEAYRCPPRLSSVPSAKASTIRPCRQPHKRGTRKTKRTPDDRSSTLCDHKTIKQTTRPPTKGTRSKYISTSRPRPATPTGAATRSARVHSPVLKPPRHTTHPHPATTGQEPMAGTRTPTPRQGGPWRPGNPTACPYPPPQQGRNDPSTPARPTPQGENPREPCQANNKILRRKEVIQPHLPVRLPCYDLVPITSLTLDGSPQQYWSGHRLRVLPTFMT